MSEREELISIFKISDKFKLLEDDYRFHTEQDREDGVCLGAGRSVYKFSLQHLQPKADLEDEAALPIKIRYNLYWYAKVFDAVNGRVAILSN